MHMYRHLMAEGGHEIVVASRKGSTLKLPVKQLVYDLPEPMKQGKTGLAERAVALGLSLADQLKPLVARGWAPDYILSHASRGASYFLRELFPDARITSLFEWYYAPPPLKDADRKTFAAQHRNSVMTNMPIVRDFETMDAGYVPTNFQRDQFPKSWHDRLMVLHDGIDTARFAPDQDAMLTVGDKRFTATDEIVTYAARGMEHTRGFPQFMEAIAQLQKRRPGLQVLVAAADRICYDPSGKGTGLKTWAMENVDFDRERTHFLGLLPEAQFIPFLQVSSLHIYLTRPFVLSWSMLNAMSVGVPLVASDTAPVREAVTHKENGILVDMHDRDALVTATAQLLDDRAGAHALGAAARQSVVERYDLKPGLERLLKLVHGS